jgi:hypothetical protein
MSAMLRFFTAFLGLALLACGDGPTDRSAFGSLILRTETGGAELDPDGYTIRLDQQEPRSIGLTDSVLMENVSVGQHTVELADVADNCTPLAQNPLDITTLAAARTDVTLQVICAGPTGNITVRTFTQGTGGDPDGFVVRLDGTEMRGIERTGAVGFIVPAGSHEVLLESLTAECTVDGDNPQIVSVAAQEAVRVTFLVDCTV